MNPRNPFARNILSVVQGAKDGRSSEDSERRVSQIRRARGGDRQNAQRFNGRQSESRDNDPLGNPEIADGSQPMSPKKTNHSPET
jgi:hypothetical protein